MELKKFNNIRNGRFKKGFEVEVCIHNQDHYNANAFCKAIRKIDKRIVVDYDGSIKPKAGDWCCELKTPVLIANESFQLLEQIFIAIAFHGYTNTSCGLHDNTSPVSKKDFNKINPFWISEQPLWKQIRKSFARANNKFCQDVVLRKDIRENPFVILDLNVEKRGLKNGMFWDGYRKQEVPINYQHVNAISLWRHMIQLQDFKKFRNKNRKPITNLVKCHWHYAGINFENLQPIPTPESRIEIRGFGNKDYHLRLPEIAHYSNEALGLFEQSYEIPCEII